MVWSLLSHSMYLSKELYKQCILFVLDSYEKNNCTSNIIEGLLPDCQIWNITSAKVFVWDTLMESSLIWIQGERFWKIIMKLLQICVISKNNSYQSFIIIKSILKVTLLKVNIKSISWSTIKFYCNLSIYQNTLTLL